MSFVAVVGGLLIFGVQLIIVAYMKRRTAKDSEAKSIAENVKRRLRFERSANRIGSSICRFHLRRLPTCEPFKRLRVKNFSWKNSPTRQFGRNVARELAIFFKRFHVSKTSTHKMHTIYSNL